MSIVDADYEVDWYRVPLPKQRLAELNRRSDLRGLLQSLGHLGLLVLTGAAAVWAVETQRWWWLIPILYAHGTVAAFMINAVHELVHGTVFRSRWLNALFVHVFAFIGWINHRAFWASHSEHHKYTLHDPHDREVVVPIRYRWVNFVRTALLDPWAIRGLVRGHWRSARGKLDGEWQRDLLAGDPRHRGVRAWSACLLVCHALITAVSLALGWWIVPVLVTFTPCYGKAIFWLLNNTQHVGLQDHVKDFRLNCRTIEVNPLFRFLYWHMNYHIEHHMYAGVPCYRLRALHREIREHLPPTPQGLAATWYQIIGILWRQEREPGYQFVPRLPELASDPEPASEAAVPAPRRVAPPPSPAASGPVRVWQCSVCGFTYDEAKGLPEEGIAPGTAWADIPEDWACPDCGVAKADFTMVEVRRPAATPCDEATPCDDAAPVVIVGSGMAGYALARELRRHDRTRPVTLLTRDGGEVYAKPALSNALARGRAPEALVTQHASDVAAELGITVRTGLAVEAIERAAKTLVLVGGERLCYDHLVLALGADQITLPLAGDATDAVLRVNDLDDYRRLRARLPAGGRVLLLGGGLIGCEFANDLAASGHRVAVVDRAAQPLASLLPSAMGAGLRTALAAQGVEWHLGTTLERLDHTADGLRATLGDGTTVEAEVVLSAVGLRPRTELAQAAGLATGRGIRVDHELRTSDPSIFALGDCAEIDGAVRPFVKPLLASARALGATLAGTPSAVGDELHPVVVKTPAHPLVIAHPGPGVGEWQVEDAHCARLFDAHGRLCGFALAGARVGEEAAFSAALGREAGAAVA